VGKMSRGKSQARKDHDEAHIYSVVSTKLSSLLREPFSEHVHLLLNDAAHRLSRLVFEAYALANIHALRCLKEGIPLPLFDQAFFNSCCSNVSASRREAGSDELRATAEQYFLLRPEGFTVMDTAYLSPAMSLLAKQMTTMASNHVRFNLVNRLCDYVRQKYRGIDNKGTALAFLRCAMYEEDARALTDDVKEFKEWLGPYNPFWENEVEQNVPYYRGKLGEILKFYHTLDPNTKGLKKFSLLPLKGDYIDSFIQIDSTTLPEILKLLHRDEQKEVIRVMLPQFPQGSEERAFLELKLEARTIFDRTFQKSDQISQALWRTLFKIEAFETVRTGKRRFGRMISTNGYAASVHLQVPKIGRQWDSAEFDSVEGLKEEDYDTFIGIDPGADFVCSAFAGRTTPSMKSECIQVSTKELRHDSKMTRQKRWMRKQVQRNQEYGRTSTSLPTLRTGDLDEFTANLRRVLASAGYLFDFQRRQKFRAWRFKTARFGKQALTRAVDKILNGRDKKKTVIGFGDWSQQDGFLKGKEKAPVKKIRRMMRAMGIKVVEVDEHRTSKCCSQCGIGDNENVRYGGVKCHRVIRCNNNECKTYWHRDVNGSRNIRAVLLSMIRREAQRPVGLRRKAKRARTAT
jgi:hypothetical protein